MEAAERIPRMRTAAKIVAEIKALDPDTEVTEFHIRKLAKDGTVPVVWAGRKALINLDDILDLMWLGTDRPTEKAVPAVGASGALIQSARNRKSPSLCAWQHNRDGTSKPTREIALL